MTLIETTHRINSVTTSMVASVLLIGCAGIQPRADRFVGPPLGATWTETQRTTGSFGAGEVQLTTTRGETNWNGRQLATYSTSRASLLVNIDNGAYAAVLAPDGKQLFSWKPDWGFDFPLFVGKSWNRTYQYTIHTTNRTIPYDVTCNVESYDDVPVRAGTYKAFKISCVNTISTEETFWFSPVLGINVKLNQTRFAGNPSGAGTRDIELVSQSIGK